MKSKMSKILKEKIILNSGLTKRQFCDMQTLKLERESERERKTLDKKRVRESKEEKKDANLCCF